MTLSLYGPLQRARLQVLAAHGMPETWNSHHTNFVKGLIVEMFCEISELKGLIWVWILYFGLNLQHWQFACLSFCFCVWENPRLGFNGCHCHIACLWGREETPDTETLAWWFKVSLALPSLFISSFPDPPRYVSFEFLQLPFCFHWLSTTYSQELARVIPSA